MLTLDAARSHLLVIDFQARLMPAIHDGARVVQNAHRLLSAARRLKLPISYTEQNPEGLGPTLSALAPEPGETVLHKMTFDACRTPEAAAHLAGDADFVVIGCEAHVCLLQTVLGLLSAGRKVYVVADAIGSRMVESRTTALRRMERHGAEIVTTEMVVFEWLASAEHPDFKALLKLIK
ncbi:Isochorismate hydrolase [Roseovarius lutimaris]|uniref:Isochorismate hydrolase n=1 Tax=Roseovarius lutimaris TaxID=1005928 RepID=A0A1I4YFM8_9RHOB|nr:isochorismatase family protein [Roseovarius lutimaris]SFN36410.1 Isochorismate hydrolase [Roseovarius lutimaris]